jgi:hypothetical protein
MKKKLACLFLIALHHICLTTNNSYASTGPIGDDHNVLLTASYQLDANCGNRQNEELSNRSTETLGDGKFKYSAYVQSSPSLTATQVVTSPNAMLIAQATTTFFRNGKYRIRVEIFDAQQNLVWKVSEQELVKSFDYTTTQIISWGPKSDSILLGDLVSVDGCGLFNSPNTISKVDLRTRQILSISDIPREGVALSQDERKLAFLDGDRIVIRDLLSNRESRYKLNGKVSGLLLWSLDANSIVMVQAYRGCSDEAEYSVVEYRFDTKRVRVLLDGMRNVLKPQSWISAKILVLVDQDGGLWRLDMQKRRLLRVIGN